MKKIWLTAVFACALTACDRPGGDFPKTGKLSNGPSTDRKRPVFDDAGPAATCPVCGLTFGQKEAATIKSFDGKKYFFLLKDHGEAFQSDPTRYLGSNRAGCSPDNK